MTPPMHPSQRQLRQRCHRPIHAQQRITQLEQRIRTRGQAPMELPPEPDQLPEWIFRTAIMHTDHAAPGFDFFPRQEE